MLVFGSLGPPGAQNINFGRFRISIRKKRRRLCLGAIKGPSKVTFREHKEQKKQADKLSRYQLGVVLIPQLLRNNRRGQSKDLKHGDLEG